jgi:hypothetical protein
LFIELAPPAFPAAAFEPLRELALLPRSEPTAPVVRSDVVGAVGELGVVWASAGAAISISAALAIRSFRMSFPL